MPKRKTEKQVCPTTCIGCGAAASGYHYDAPACCSCKTFFRRAVVQGRIYKACYKGGACSKKPLNPCRTCRLERCVNGGMNPFLIASLENSETNPVVQKFLKRSQKSSNNANGFEPSTSDSEDGLSTEIESPRDEKSIIKQEVDAFRDEAKGTLILGQPHLIECKIDKIMIDLLALDDAHDRLRKSSYCPRFEDGLTIDEFCDGPSKLGIDFEPMRIQPFDPSASNIHTAEMVINRKICIDVSKFDYTTKKLWVFQDKVYAIEFVKALPVYNMMEDCSKRVLIASALACSNFTSAFYSYTHHSDRTYYPDGGTMSWTSEIHAHSPGTIRIHTGTIAAIREARLDRKEYALLKMILVHNPMLNGLTPNDVTLLQQEKENYAKMLFSYALAKHGVKEGPSVYGKMLSVLDVVTRITSYQKSVHILILAMGLYKQNVPFSETMYLSD